MGFLEVIGGPQKILHLATKLSCNKDTSFSFWRSYNQQSLILLKKDDAQGDVQEPSVYKSSQSRMVSGACSGQLEKLNSSWSQNKVLACILKVSDEEGPLV